jgi:hypothetical protein
MPREPFVWEVHLRQDALDDVVDELRRLPYEVLRAIIDTPLKKKVTARDNREYRVVVTAEWIEAGSEQIRVTARLRRGLFRAPLVASFVVPR